MALMVLGFKVLMWPKIIGMLVVHALLSTTIRSCSSNSNSNSNSNGSSSQGNAIGGVHAFPSASVTMMATKSATAAAITTTTIPFASITSHAEYAVHWDSLLLEEHDHQTKELRDRRSSWCRSRLEALGIAILDAVAEPDSDMLGEKIVRVVTPADRKANLQDKFSRGDMLLMTCLRRDIDVLPKECLVVDVGRHWLTVGVGPAWPKGLWEARKLPGYYPVRMDRTAPKAPLTAQRMALEQVRKGFGGRAVSGLVASMMGHPGAPTSTSASSKHDAAAARNVGNGADDDTDKRLWAEALERAVQQIRRTTSTATSFQPNESQKSAIVWALQRDLSLIRGPPGTGKTRVAALLVSTYLQYHDMAKTTTTATTTSGQAEGAMPARVLAVTHSNGAADVLLEALLQVGVPAVRLGRPASVSPSLQHRTVAAMAERHPEVKHVRSKCRDFSLPSHERNVAQYEIRQRLVDVQRSIAHTAPVVVASCIGAQQLMEKGSQDVRFPLVVLDEAAQTTEPSLICALVAAKADQVVMVGDTRQLPPTVSASNLRRSLGVSPMARLEKAGVARHTLAVQYRMSPSLLEHPSSYFYNGLVKCADETLDDARSPPRGFPWPSVDQHLAFVQVGPDKEATHSFGGKSNPAEADMVAKIIGSLVAGGDVNATDVAVISPYSKQVQLIRTELALRRLGDVRVGTVDSFQGQETDVVVFSCVRSNQFGELGFLRDPRRLCVAITRARRGLVVVGDEPVLRSSHHWSALLDSMRDRNCMVDASELERRYCDGNDASSGSLLASRNDTAVGLDGDRNGAGDEDEDGADLSKVVEMVLADLMGTSAKSRNNSSDHDDDDDDDGNDKDSGEDVLFGLFEKPL
eukprot:CAMPEP_0119571358 /NCGR_PEP_ID=MMETSP1352-20130426/44079_1 /TAXON_ID=265584 /ORGANISM="Stauroneis constricta, Strain CCMP1120" /LENGTH=861 /DNA_ID=CAMNT_0007621037 /DNA_START=1034 /DNA_END=3619 /DNA_ORIENTATION=-